MTYLLVLFNCLLTMNSDTFNVSLYRDSLAGDVRQRYDQKIDVIGEDPYILRKQDFVNDRNQWPEVTNFDIIEFFVFKESAYTRDQLRNHKSLDAYKYFQDGWVHDLLHKKYDTGHHLIKAKVNHSMRIREKPLEPWVIFSDGKGIESAHCTCMAGLGECCSHVGAVLFALEQSTKARDKTSVTDEPAYWLFPSRAKFDTPYKRVKDMDFQSAAKKRKQSGLPLIPEHRTNAEALIPSPTKHEEETFFSELYIINPKSAVLSLTDKFCSTFEPSLTKMNAEMQKHFECDFGCDNMTYEEMINYCEDKSKTFNISEKHVEHIEKETRKQSNSSTWFKLRCGRITASNFHAVCRTDIRKPSPSLLKKITRNSNEKVVCAAIEWGKKKEHIARKQYVYESSHKHDNLKVDTCGLYIGKEFHQLAASPDGILTCDCCGKGLIEVKCPYSMKDKQDIDLKYLQKDQDDEGKFKLCTSHQYYYQVQLQLFVTGLNYCDFVVWWPNGCHSERILKDADFLKIEIPKALDFHKMCVLPELVFGYFSRKTVLTTTRNTNNDADNDVINDSEKYCICGGVDDGTKMIMCEHENCQKLWYHMKCINMKRAPKGKWICAECKSLN